MGSLTLASQCDAKPDNVNGELTPLFSMLYLSYWVCLLDPLMGLKWTSWLMQFWNLINWIHSRDMWQSESIWDSRNKWNM